jgi:hypothetical protein
MERRRYLAAAALLLALPLSNNAVAAYKVVIDPWTVAAVTANAGSQKLIEEKHNARLDSISARQQKMLKYTAAMASIKELYKMTMQNVTGFGEETAYYRDIFLCAADIFTLTPQVITAIGKNPGKNYVLCLNELTNVMAETEGLVHDFVEIVNNGKVRLPDIPAIRQNMPAGGGRYNMGTNDGHNFLDRYERLTLANGIYSRLLTIRSKMQLMVMMCQYGTWGDVLFAIDPETWAGFLTGANIVNDLVYKWNGLSV